MCVCMVYVCVLLHTYIHMCGIVGAQAQHAKLIWRNEHL